MVYNCEYHFFFMKNSIYPVITLQELLYTYLINERRFTQSFYSQLIYSLIYYFIILL